MFMKFLNATMINILLDALKTYMIDKSNKTEETD